MRWRCEAARAAVVDARREALRAARRSTRDWDARADALARVRADERPRLRR